jgi:Mg-dependent DNase
MELIFDTHAHYDDAAFQEDREEILSGLSDHGDRLRNNRRNRSGIEHAVCSSSLRKLLDVGNGILLKRIERDIGAELRGEFPPDGIDLGEDDPAATLLAEHDMVDSHNSAADNHNGVGKLQICLADAVDAAGQRLG